MKCSELASKSFFILTFSSPTYHPGMVSLMWTLWIPIWIGFVFCVGTVIGQNYYDNYTATATIGGAIVAAKDDRIPFWNIAHMANSFKEIHESLKAGANALEIDVVFDKDGYPKEVFHGLPCDCTRHCTYQESFVKYLKYLATITDTSVHHSYPNDLTLIMLDLKLSNLSEQSKTAAGIHLAKLIDKYIYGNGPRFVKIILCVNHVQDKYLIGSFLEHVNTNNMVNLQRNVGFDVSMNDPVGDILGMWRQFNNVTTNIWQGDGITNCGSFLRDFGRLKEAALARDQGQFFKKIYFWTVDLIVHMRKVLGFGIDAIITNHPERTLEVLQEPEFRDRYRMANLLDDPFERLRMPYFTNQRKSLPTLKDAASVVDNTKYSFSRYVSQTPEALLDLGNLLLAKSLQKVSDDESKATQKF